MTASDVSLSMIEFLRRSFLLPFLLSHFQIFFDFRYSVFKVRLGLIQIFARRVKWTFTSSQNLFRMSV